ncbi:MAG TPA: hypothetical protein DF610_19340, partial [Sphingobacterium sp.]|nr:hypothetical protein [Sphingobacterium sp.]
SNVLNYNRNVTKIKLGKIILLKNNKIEQIKEIKYWTHQYNIQNKGNTQSIYQLVRIITLKYTATELRHDITVAS